MKNSTFVMLVCASAMMLWGCDAKTKADLDAARNKAKETKTKAEDTKAAGEQEASDKICEQAPTLHKTALDREISIYYRAGLAPLYSEMDLKAHAEDPSKELTPNPALASAAEVVNATRDLKQSCTAEKVDPKKVIALEKTIREGLKQPAVDVATYSFEVKELAALYTIPETFNGACDQLDAVTTQVTALAPKVAETQDTDVAPHSLLHGAVTNYAAALAAATETCNPPEPAEGEEAAEPMVEATIKAALVRHHELVRAGLRITPDNAKL